MKKYKTDSCVATHMGRLVYILKGVSDGRKGVIARRISELKYHPQPLRQSRQRYSFSAGRAPPNLEVIKPDGPFTLNHRWNLL
jgi:hypothetical protein